MLGSCRQRSLILWTGECSKLSQATASNPCDHNTLIRVICAVTPSTKPIARMGQSFLLTPLLDGYTDVGTVTVMSTTSSSGPQFSNSQMKNGVDERTNILEAIRHSSFDQLMAEGQKWCPQNLGDVLAVLLTDSPDTATVRQGAARIVKVQLREPDTHSRRETGALGSTPMSPDGAQQVQASRGQTGATGLRLSAGDQNSGSAR